MTSAATSWGLKSPTTSTFGSRTSRRGYRRHSRRICSSSSAAMRSASSSVRVLPPGKLKIIQQTDPPAGQLTTDRLMTNVIEPAAIQPVYPSEPSLQPCLNRRSSYLKCTTVRRCSVDRCPGPSQLGLLWTSFIRTARGPQ